jgi:hypothetical protein
MRPLDQGKEPRNSRRYPLTLPLLHPKLTTIEYLSLLNSFIRSTEVRSCLPALVPPGEALGLSIGANLCAQKSPTPCCRQRNDSRRLRRCSGSCWTKRSACARSDGWPLKKLPTSRGFSPGQTGNKGLIRPDREWDHLPCASDERITSSGFESVLFPALPFFRRDPAILPIDGRPSARDNTSFLADG